MSHFIVSPIIMFFFSPIETLRETLRFDRSITIEIVNHTKKDLKYVAQHMDCGKIRSIPGIIKAGGRSNIYANSKYGAFGVKGALIYQWGNKKEKICFLFKNPVRGRNKSGIKYYLDTNNKAHWYYRNVPTVKSGDTMSSTINRFHISSYVSGGNAARGAFVLKT